MDVTRRSTDPAGLLPAAFDVLPETAPHHVSRNARPPRTTYTLAWDRIVERFHGSLDALDRLLSDRAFFHDSSGEWASEILAAHEGLLYAVVEHFDDCRRIIESFVDPSDKKDKRSKNFEARVARFRDGPATIVNRIKHNQRRLRVVAMWESEHASRVSLGYYVEGIGQTAPWEGV